MSERLSGRLAVRGARAAVVAAVVSALAAPAAAQTTAPPASTLGSFIHGVPTGTASAEPLALSLADAVTRGLDHNLSVLIQDQSLQNATGERWKALADLLPKAAGHLSDTREKVNLAAFGFSGFPGFSLPSTVVGPFTVLDARVSVSAPIVDLDALGTLQRRQAEERAAQHSVRDARSLVVLAVSNLYLQAVADASRVTAAQSQAEVAEALLKLAQDQRAAGVVAGIDVLRQQVQLEGARQRVIAAENDRDKLRLQLARTIGLPVGQAFTLTSTLTYTPPPAITVEQATTLAEAQREDLKAAVERVNAARAERRSARGAYLPSLHFDADYGDIGPTASSAQATFDVGATLRIPIFEGGDTHGRVLQADADLQGAEDRLADLRAGVAYDVRTALLDLQSADNAVQVASQAQDLATQELTQARDRFSAGVGTSVELAQAQDAVAAATDTYILSLYSQILAKGELARAMGVSEQQALQYLGGQR